MQASTQKSVTTFYFTFQQRKPTTGNCSLPVIFFYSSNLNWFCPLVWSLEEYWETHGIIKYWAVIISVLMTLTEYTGKKYISKDTQTTKLIERNNQFQIEIINPQSITSSLKKIYHDILPISFWQCNHILLFDWINKVFT